MKRRDFLKNTAATTAAALAMGQGLSSDSGASTGNPAKLPRRAYGKHAVELSVIGMGGIVVTDAEQNHANRVVAEAVERGVNYFDVAPSYGDAEVKLGPALQPYRKNAFLACKTTHRDRAGAEAEFNRSLEHMRTDYFDLYQLHAVQDVAKDIDAAFAKGGVMELLIEAKRDGRVRHLGFSAHSVPAALAAMDRYEFDSILFPINFATFTKGNFGPQIMEKAVSKGVARLALKMLARQKWPENDAGKKQYPKCWYQPLSDPAEAELGMAFTLSQPVTAAIPPGDESLFRLAVELAMKYKPITPAQEAQLAELTKSLRPLFEA